MNAEENALLDQWNFHSIDFSASIQPDSSNPSLSFDQPEENQLFGVCNNVVPPPKEGAPLNTIPTASVGIGNQGVHSKDGVGTEQKTKRRYTKSLGASDELESGSTSRGAERKNPRLSPTKLKENGLNEEEKRERFLERNRLAASKCRDRKKLWSSSLEERARILSTQRRVMVNYITLLRHELLELRCKCLNHNGCDCKQIRQYLQNSVAHLDTGERSPAGLSPLPKLEPSPSSKPTSPPIVERDSDSPHFDEAQEPSTALASEMALHISQLEYDAFAALVNSSGFDNYQGDTTRSSSKMGNLGIPEQTGAIRIWHT